MKYPKIVGTVALLATLGIGIGIGSGTASHTNTQTTVTKTVNVPGPTKTVIKTVTVPAPPPAAGSTLQTFHGTGNEVTPQFNVPSDGNYILAWSYSGNVDSSFGSSEPTNFSIMPTGDGFGDTPNDIAASGHGSTEVTGADSHDSLNVQAAGSWTITIKST